jgi:hypothetical protein
MTRRGVQWLSEAAEDPETCRKEWASDPRLPYALPAGRLFDVVVVPQRLGMEIFDQLVRRAMPFGPVMIDHGSRQMGFFLNSHWCERFARFVGRETDTPPSYRYLSEGSFVVVPGPMPLSRDRYQWLNAPIRRPEANPLRPAALAVMLVAAADLIVRADSYGQQYPTPEAAAEEAMKETAADAQ